MEIDAAIELRDELFRDMIKRLCADEDADELNEILRDSIALGAMIRRVMASRDPELAWARDRIDEAPDGGIWS